MIKDIKNCYFGLVCALILMVSMSGCTTFSGIKGFFGKSSKTVAVQQNKINTINTSIASIAVVKANNISSFSYGVGLSLSKVTNKEPAIMVAKELNNRVESIAGLPNLEEQTAMIKLVNDLISNNVAGEVALAKADKSIIALQSEESLLLNEKDKEINNALNLSKNIALENDTNKQTLDAYNSYWGLGGVVLGFKHFMKNSFIAIIIFAVIFIILRLAAATNPLANAIFSIFQNLAAAFIHIIEKIVPASIDTLKDVVESVNTNVAVKAAIATTTNTISATVPIQANSNVSSSTIIPPVSALSSIITKS